MPFRAKMKRAFGKDSPEDGSDPPKKEKKQKVPDNVYKPGEPMPRPKYRGPWDKEHQDKLTSFSFAKAFGRRNSDHSEYSPMGSKLPSRRGSFLNVGRMSFARSRQHSHVDPALMEATEGDDDVANGTSIAYHPSVIIEFHLTTSSWSVQAAHTGREQKAQDPR